MIKFHVFRGETKKECTAADVTRAVEILKLVFGDAKAYIVEGDNIVYFQNMSMEDARTAAGLQPVILNSIEELPPAPAPKKKAKKKTPTVKKTKVKSKVVVKTPKKAVKKTKVKSKVQPNGKAKKVKAKNKKPAKANGKAKKR